MTIFEFVEELCDIIAGEDAYYRYQKDELIRMCKTMKDNSLKTVNDPELFPVRHTLKEARARQAAARQGQL